MSESFINSSESLKNARLIFRKFIPLLVAVMLQQFLGLFVNLLDNFMLGQFSEAAMSGASIVNQIHGVAGNLIFAAGSGVAMLGSQYWGKRDITSIKKIFADGLKTSFAIGLIFTLMTAIFPEQILGLLTNDSVILEQAVSYVSIICWTYVIFSVSSVLMISLQSVETAFVGTIMSASTIVINFCMNYVLIYGNFGAPRLGILGAAYATLTSRIIELIIVLCYIFLKDKKLRIKPAELFSFKTGFYKDYIKVASPIMIAGGSWGLGLAAQTAILGHLSAQAIGASSISVTVAQMFLVASYSAASASGVVMGKAVGSGQLGVIRDLTKLFQIFFVLLGLLMGLLMFLLRGPIIGLYSVSNETRELTEKFFVIMSISVVGSAYEYPVMGGLIAGGGNTRYQSIIDITFMWLFIIPMSALSAFVFKWSEEVTFIFLKADQLLKCIPNAIYCNSYKWVRNLTR